MHSSIRFLGGPAGSCEPERIDVERPPHTPMRERGEGASPERQEPLQCGAIGALCEHVAALDPGAARKHGGQRRKYFDRGARIANESDAGCARLPEESVDRLALRCLGGKQGEMRIRRQARRAALDLDNLGKRRVVVRGERPVDRMRRKVRLTNTSPGSVARPARPATWNSSAASRSVARKSAL